jgi:VIT1/CCC1 family predicted Fe2+/Mn2+ transporter
MTATEDEHRIGHAETHSTGRTNWLRAAVLGSNDAIISTSSLMIGVGASAASPRAIMISGIAGLVAGSMSMAAGEFVSVSSQRDAEQASVALEKRELAADPEAELRELTRIYVARGLDDALALRVAEALSEKDRLRAHLRDELGIHLESLANPLQAAWISASSFAAFAAIPVLALLVAPAAARTEVIAAVSLISLGVLGAVGARLGRAPLGPATLRVVLGGALAMSVTAGIGALLGVSAR